jgi:AbrB family looped-hinge helix DNA binding protein
MEMTATGKGQVVIPALVRKMFGIKEGTRILVEADEKSQTIILKPITREYVFSLRGKFKGKGLMKALLEEKAKEKVL